MRAVTGLDSLESEAKYLVEIEETLCKGCELCISVCPKGNLLLDPIRLNGSGYHPVVYSYSGIDGDCIGCGVCFTICPDAAVVAVWERE